MEQQSFGYWLKLKRKGLNLTRDQLAERVGYSAATIRKIEDEERHPSAQVIERLAEIFNIPQDERSAFLHFARGDLKSASSESLETLPWRVSGKRSPPNLPAATTSLIGREKEIVTVREYLLRTDIRLVTLIGPPGIGKTRLSIEAARAALSDFPDGVFFVALAPLEDSNLIASAVAQALGYVGARNISTTEQLKEGIGNKQMLLVLDNCEHLIEAVASLASDLLSACPQLKIIATSRESLRISGEWTYAVPAFDLPIERASLNVESASTYPALTLFVERARAVRSDFSLNADNIQTVAAICARLDGLPLVIELIAARMRLMTPQALLARLSSQFVLTADGMRAASGRQRTLHNAIDWSYKLLPTEEQKLFAYLSVFSGGFTPEAVQDMFFQRVTEKPLSHLVALLLDKSLLKLAPDPEARGETRYTMLATIQEYARERLQEMGEQTEIRNLHLAYFLALAEKADREVRGHHQLEWLRHLHSGRDNLRAALDWAIETGQTKLALQIARRLHWFWFVHGDHNEGGQWLQRALGMPDISLYPDARAEALTQLAHHAFILIHHSGLRVEGNNVRTLAELALSIARANGDKHNIARALAMLGLALTYDEDFVAAQSVLEESQALYREVHDEWGYAHALMCLSWSFFKHDHLEASLSLNEQALALFRKLGDRYFISVTLRGMAGAHLKQNNLASAVAELREALSAAHELKSKYEIAVVLAWWAEAEKQFQNPVRSVCLFWAYRNILDSIGVWSENDESEFENDLAPCRAALAEAEFEAAVEDGRAMTMEQAVAYALEDQE